MAFVGERHQIQNFSIGLTASFGRYKQIYSISFAYLHIQLNERKEPAHSMILTTA